MIFRIANKLWNIFSGSVQWKVLWLVNNKFVVGFSAVVLDESGRVLLLRHTFRRTNCWSLPSGWMKRGETIGDAARREVLEETGLAISVVLLSRVSTAFQYRIAFFLACRVEGAGDDLTVDGKEVQEAGFFALDCLPDNVPLADKKVIEEAVNALRKGQSSLF